MKLTVCILWVLCISFGEGIKFEFVPGFKDRSLFSQSILDGAQFNQPHPPGCAEQCSKHARCSMFSFAATVCQLYGDLNYPDEASASMMFGMRYYAYVEGWCSLKNGFLMLRESNLCLKIIVEEMTYWDSCQHCTEIGGHIAVLDTPVKATAVVNLLKQLGLSSNATYLGLTEGTTDGGFVWDDGTALQDGVFQLLTNVLNELNPPSCVYLAEGKIFDSACVDKRISICQMSETKKINNF